MREYKTLGLTEFKADGDGAGTFEGRASTFDSIDSYGDVVDRGAYTETIPQFLERGFIAWGHNWANPIGFVTDAKEREDGLWITGQFHSDEESQIARIRARERVEAGRFMGLSIGYEAVEWEVRETDPPVRNRWGELTDKIRALTKIKLYEVSLVTVPAEPLAQVVGVKGQGLIAGLEEAREWLRALSGRPDNEIDADARRFLHDLEPVLTDFAALQATLNERLASAAKPKTPVLSKQEAEAWAKQAMAKRAEFLLTTYGPGGGR